MFFSINVTIEFLCQGQEERFDYCNRPRRHCLEVLYDFHHVKVPLEYLFDLFPAIKPRAFSIASSAKALPGTFQKLASSQRVLFNLMIGRQDPTLGGRGQVPLEAVHASPGPLLELFVFPPSRSGQGQHLGARGHLRLLQASASTSDNGRSRHGCRAFQVNP